MLYTLMDKFEDEISKKKLPKEYIDKIKLLPEESVELIAAEIFNLEKVSDLERYF